MVDVTVEIDIARPLAAVWSYTTTVANDTTWTTGLVEARQLTDGPLAVGSRVERVSRFLGRRMVYVIEIVAVDEGRRVTMHTTSGPFPMTIHYEYEDAPNVAPGGGARFRIHTTGEPGGFFASASPVVAAAVRRSIGNDLAALKRVLEEAG